MLLTVYVTNLLSLCLYFPKTMDHSLRQYAIQNTLPVMLLLARGFVTTTEMKSETKHPVPLLEHQILPTFPSLWQPSFVLIISNSCPILIKVFLPGQSFMPSYRSLDYSVQWFINTLKLEGSYTHYAFPYGHARTP